ncbi:MAG: hypothetical protein JSR33_13960, partial [Proteobacteria bacterium]|nr:hypothetical protein [Pseudomonadota bacterium]
MKKITIGAIAALSVIGICQAQTPAAGQAPNSEQMPPSGSMGTGQMSKGEMGYKQTSAEGETNSMGKKRVTLRIVEPASLRAHDRKMHKPNVITFGERTFKLPPG